MNNRKFLVLCACLAVSLAGILCVSLFQKRSRTVDSKAPHPHQDVATPKAKAEVQLDPSALRPQEQHNQRTAKSDWRVALKSEIPDIAAKLPDLGSTPVESMLKRFRTAKPKERLIKKGDALVAIEMYEPSSPEERTFALPPSLEKEDGFQRLSRLLVDHVITQHVEDGPQKSPQELADILKMPDTALGTSAEEMKVLTALRWSAAVALRGFPLTTQQRADIELLATQSSDEVLRGALVGTLTAFKVSDDFVKQWMVNETSDRALQGLLVELGRGNWRTEFREDSDAKFVEEGGKKKLTAKGPVISKTYPVSGEQLAPQLLAILRRPDLNEQLVNPAKGEDIGLNRIPFRTSRVERTDEGTTPVEDPFGDAKSLSMEALVTRMDPALINTLIGTIDELHTPRMKTQAIEIIGMFKSPESESVLLNYVVDSQRTNSERAAAMWGLMAQDTPRAIQAVEALLWEKNLTIRKFAGGALLYNKVSLSTEAVERLKWLANEDPNVESRQYFGKMYYRVNR